MTGAYEEYESNRRFHHKQIKGHFKKKVTRFIRENGIETPNEFFRRWPGYEQYYAHGKEVWARRYGYDRLEFGFGGNNRNFVNAFVPKFVNYHMRMNMAEMLDDWLEIINEEIKHNG